MNTSQMASWVKVPNLVGYVRLILLILFFISDNPLHKALFIGSSLLLDMVDGRIARLLNQTSLFGARLDLIADMIALVTLSFYAAALSQNPALVGLFVFCGLSDAINYGLSLLLFYGHPKQNLDHKKELKNAGFLLPIYYSTSGLFASNVLHDLFLLINVYCPSFLPSYLIYLLFGGYLFRQCCLVQQAYHLLRLFKRRSGEVSDRS